MYILKYLACIEFNHVNNKIHSLPNMFSVFCILDVSKIHCLPKKTEKLNLITKFDHNT